MAFSSARPTWTARLYGSACQGSSRRRQALPLASRQELLADRHRLCPQRQGEPDRAERDLAGCGPVEPNRPAVVWAIEMDLLVQDRRALDAVDRDLVEPALEPGAAPVD